MPRHNVITHSTIEPTTGIQSRFSIRLYRFVYPFNKDASEFFHGLNGIFRICFQILSYWLIFLFGLFLPHLNKKDEHVLEHLPKSDLDNLLRIVCRLDFVSFVCLNELFVIFYHLKRKEGENQINRNIYE